MEVLSEVRSGTPLKTFIRKLEESDKLLNEFDEDLWNKVIEEVTEYLDHKIIFMFKNRMKLEWNI